MSSWGAVARSEPDFAARVRELFESGRHKTIATLRADGSPRISGIECQFTDDELTFGSMPGSRKGADLKRDPRFALHGPSSHPPKGREGEWPGEAKIAGSANLITQTADSDHPAGDMFVADITEAVFTHLNLDASKLVIELWSPDRGVVKWERD